ncbi:MAG: GNAT family N-acetyltransferase [Acidimicrobiales bacterium]|nr:GNAT family N-acetyltransferase [Acidimicrobiales bacterium]
MSDNKPDIDVTDVVDSTRYEAKIGGKLAGFVEYERRDGKIIFPHTEVDDAFGGQGVGSALARTALDTALTDGEAIVPLCPFIAGYIDRHSEYAELVDHEMLARLRSDDVETEASTGGVD